MIVVLALSRRVFALRVVAAGLIVGLVVMVAAGLRGGRVGTVACGGRSGAITAPLAVLRSRQAVVGLLDADPVPGFRVCWEPEARVAQQSVGDELRGTLPALGLALTPAACGA